MTILVIRFSSAGDIILTSTFMRALRARFSGAEIHYLTKQEYEPLVKFSPYISRSIGIPPGLGLRDLMRFKSELLRDNQGDYDLVFDLHDSLRSRYVRLGMGAETAVIRKPTFRKQLLVQRKVNRLLPVIPMPERYIATGARYGLVNDGAGLDLFLGNTLPPITPVTGTPTVALAPGARHATKRWPPENFTALGNLLYKTMGARILLLGSTAERPLCGEIAAGIMGETINLAGRASLLESAAALDSCQAVVANDSAVTHLASARKRPVVALFGSTVREFGFAPYGTLSVVVENDGLYCRPCSTIGRERCPEGHFRCMREITPDRVLAAVSSLC